MKIMWHSVVPWAGSGYGQQTAVWVPRLASLGHEVAVSAYHGLYGGPVDWHGFTVYPGGVHRQGADSLPVNAAHFGADLVITLMDFWALGPEAPLKGMPVAAWMPLDTDPLSEGDRVVLADSGAVPIAMSRFGEKQLKNAGFDCLYVPHGIDTEIFKPVPDRAAQRQAMGLADRFVVMMNAANMDRVRKGWPEQFEAFARLARKHPDALLFCHTLVKNPASADLGYMAEDFGIAKKNIVFSSQIAYAQGLITPPELAATYSAADLFSGCAYAEGFGLPLVEAQACGTPAVATDFSAMTETCWGWHVPWDKYYVTGHRSFWGRPRVDAIARVYEKAYERGPVYQSKRSQARTRALDYDADRVLVEHWKNTLQELEGRVTA